MFSSPAVSPLRPDADVLVLVGDVDPAVKVVGLDLLRSAAEVVLGAALRGKVAELAVVLGHLQAGGVQRIITRR